MSDFPAIFRVRQTFERPCIADVAAEVHRQLTRLKLQEKVRCGESVAITAGSRGVANIAIITRSIVDHFKRLDAKPFVVPAMGSHGGGTAEGQRRLIESYGMTEAFLGCPIRSSTETVIVGQAAEGFPIHFDRLAFEANHVVVCNRVKPHTGFAGDIESGLMKMLLIGLGKCEGAGIYHRAIQDFSFDRILRGVAPRILQTCPILAGLAIVENAYDETACLEAVESAQFEPREKELLALAKRLLPRLPFQQVDVLLIDRLGKDISGTGMDPNIIGRKFNDHKAMPDELPKVRRIAVRSLTPHSHGNAIGLGMAEFCRSQLLDGIDREATRLNGLISGHISAAMMPLDYPTDRDMLAAALRTIGLTEPRNAKLLWIADTLHLSEVACSAAFLAEARERTDLEVFDALRPLPFNAAGNLPEASALRDQHSVQEIHTTDLRGS